MLLWQPEVTEVIVSGKLSEQRQSRPTDVTCRNSTDKSQNHQWLGHVVQGHIGWESVACYTDCTGWAESIIVEAKHILIWQRRKIGYIFNLLFIHVVLELEWYRNGQQTVRV